MIDLTDPNTDVKKLFRQYKRWKLKRCGFSRSTTNRTKPLYLDSVDIYDWINHSSLRLNGEYDKNIAIQLSIIWYKLGLIKNGSGLFRTWYYI